MEFGIVHLLCHLIKIGGIITDTLDITDALHQHAALAVVTFQLNIGR